MNLQNIQMKIKYSRQLFDERDPSPFIEKDIDDDAADYLFSYAQEIGLKKLGSLEIIIENKIEEDERIPIAEAINNYFSYRYDLALIKFKKMISEGIRSLFIASLAMGVSLFVVYKLQGASETFFYSYLEETLVVMSWVAMWKPLNIFLYEWWRVRSQLKILKALSTIKVELLESIS